jgi:hypothetical protein
MFPCFIQQHGNNEPLQGKNQCEKEGEWGKRINIYTKAKEERKEVNYNKRKTRKGPRD